MKMRRSSDSSRSPDPANPADPAHPADSPPLLPFVESKPGGLFLRVRLVPRASQEKVDGVVNKALKIRITAPPVEGEANKALIRFLSGLTGLPGSSFSIAPGSLKSKDKKVKVEGASEKELCAVLKNALRASGLTI